MADDPNPALRAELQASLAVLTPEIRGLHDLRAVSISPELATAIAAQITIRERRRNLIQSVLDSLDAVIVARRALENDGYPLLDDVQLGATQFSELQGELADLEAAMGVFKPQMATTMSVALGIPVAKTTP
jgi:hypothetical protein